MRRKGFTVFVGFALLPVAITAPGAQNPSGGANRKQMNSRVVASSEPVVAGLVDNLRSIVSTK